MVPGGRTADDRLREDGFPLVQEFRARLGYLEEFRGERKYGRFSSNRHQRTNVRRNHEGGHLSQSATF